MSKQIAVMADLYRTTMQTKMLSERILQLNTEIKFLEKSLIRLDDLHFDDDFKEQRRKQLSERRVQCYELCKQYKLVLDVGILSSSSQIAPSSSSSSSSSPGILVSKTSSLSSSASSDNF
jgi:hypothetical protein